ncbi:hypothetical protein NKR23_g2118 [Pleurostoma richardsiae]|uniref:Uncharacterized protein n=1 Tax=Pleurostoma richardsiae TaxID=41990 RepID=A0AA38S3G3_9PEZI|nr:hypothetical protein NKR23_g2118 [Pleurostoma richardsiae]
MPSGTAKKNASHPLFRWDYSDRTEMNDAQDLHNYWKELNLLKKDKSPLMPREREEVESLSKLSKNEKEDQLQSMFKSDIKVFERTKLQLVSLLIVWDRILHEKRQFDEQGSKFQGSQQLNKESCLMALKIIPRRALIGLPRLTTVAKRRRQVDEEESSGEEPVAKKRPNDISDRLKSKLSGGREEKKPNETPGNSKRVTIKVEDVPSDESDGADRKRRKRKEPSDDDQPVGKGKRIDRQSMTESEDEETEKPQTGKRLGAKRLKK